MGRAAEDDMIVWIGMFVATAASIYWAKRAFELEAEKAAIQDILIETIRERDEAWSMLSRLADR
jgi:hypothetical protein